MRPETRAGFEIAIICALPREADPVLALFDEHYEEDGFSYGKQIGDSNAYSTGRIGLHHVVLAHMPNMGNNSAASVAAGLRISFTKLELALVVGICGGVPFPTSKQPIILGDVVISNHVIEFGFGRQYPDVFERKRDVKDTLGRPDREVRSVLAKLKTSRNLQALLQKTVRNLLQLQEIIDTATYPGVIRDRLFTASYRHMHYQDFVRCGCSAMSGGGGGTACEVALKLDCDTLGCSTLETIENPARHDRLNTNFPDPLVHIGTIGSADTVMKSGQHRDDIAQRDAIIAFEMEGAGVWDNLPCVIIKGVCDYADSHKNKEWQDYAAATAASAAKGFLEFWIPVNSDQALAGQISRNRKRSIDEDHTTNHSKKPRPGPSFFDRADTVSGSSDVRVYSTTSQRPTADQAILGHDRGITVPNQIKPSDTAPGDYVNRNPRQAVLQSLQFEQLDARYDDIKRAHSETCKWLLSKSEYADWQDHRKLSEHNGFWWIKGKPGSGKSTIMKYALAEARSSMTDSVIISFFFNARGAHLEKSTTGMYRSLLFQLLEKVPRLQEILETASKDFRAAEPPEWKRETLQLLFGQAVERLAQCSVVCFVDALDECDSDDHVRDMVNFFEEVGERAASSDVRFLVCFSSRHYPHISIEKSVELILETEAGHKEDIARYLRSKLKVGRSKRAEQIKIKAEEKSAGIFLWVVLVVPLLQKAYDKGHMHDLQKCLDEIPDDLHKLFRDILTRDTDNMEDLVLCLQWILFAIRPLKPEELYFAVLSGVDSASITSWDPDDITSDDIGRFLLSSSKGLADLTKSKHQTVQFIHESVRDYFLKEKGFATLQKELETSSAGSAHERLKQCCVHYLESIASGCPELSDGTLTAESLTDSKQSMIMKKFPFLEYAVRHVFQHAEAAASYNIPQDIFLSYFGHEKWILLHNLVERHKIRRHESNTSMLYILIQHCGPNLVQLEIQRSKSINVKSGRYDYPIILSAVLCNQPVVELLLRHGADVNAKGEAYGNALAAAVDKSNMQIAKLLIQQGAELKGHAKTLNRSMLRAAIENGDLEMARLLLEKGLRLGSNSDILRTVAGKEFNGPLTEQGFDVNSIYKEKSPLAVAVEKGNIDMLKLLLQHGATVFKGKHSSPTEQYSAEIALYWASGMGHGSLVQWLLDQGANVNNKYQNHANALYQACREGHSQVAKILLEHGADVKASGGYHGNALQTAAQSEDFETVRLLLEHGADVNASGGHYGNALQAAAQSENFETVRLLLEHGADVNASGGRHDNALQAAAESGHFETVRILLEHGANVKACGGFYGNALQAAANCGSFETVRLLLEHGADVNASGGRHGNALQAAANFGSSETIQLLLEHGANVNASGGHYGNALQAASSSYSHRSMIVHILLEHGADVNACGGEHGTALKAACACNNLEVVQLLLDLGADVNACAENGSALEIASGKGWQPIVGLLLERGAR